MSDNSSLTKNRLHNFFNEEVKNYLLTTRMGNDPEVALKNVGYTILWACALDEFYQKTHSDYEVTRKKASDSNVIAGIRYARNRAIHQFTQLLYITDGAEFPISFPITFFEIRWKANSDLPMPDKKFKQTKLEMSYINYLENKSVQHTFQDLINYFERIYEVYKDK